MNKNKSRALRKGLACALTFLMAFGIVPQTLAALFLTTIDLDGDAIPENVYNNGGRILVTNIYGETVGQYTLAGTWYGVGFADLDGIPGAEYVVRTSDRLIVVNHRTKTVSQHVVAGISGWLPMAISEFDGVAGNEVAINAGILGNYGSIVFFSYKTNSFKRHYFSAQSSWIALSANDYDGVAGKEYAVYSSDYIAILHPRTLEARYYYVGSGWKGLGQANLDGYAGNELVYKLSTGLIVIFHDRNKTTTYH